MTTSGHYDARGARNCQPGTTRSGTITDPSGWSGRNVTGIQKAAGCTYNQTSPPSYSGCSHVPASGCTFPAESAGAWTHTSHAILLRAQDGTVNFNSGGVPSDFNN